jgi:hypothetical protein
MRIMSQQLQGSRLTSSCSSQGHMGVTLEPHVLLSNRAVTAVIPQQRHCSQDTFIVSICYVYQPWNLESLWGDKSRNSQ